MLRICRAFRTCNFAGEAPQKEYTRSAVVFLYVCTLCDILSILSHPTPTSIHIKSPSQPRPHPEPCHPFWDAARCSKRPQGASFDAPSKRDDKVRLHGNAARHFPVISSLSAYFCPPDEPWQSSRRIKQKDIQPKSHMSLKLKNQNFSRHYLHSLP